MPDQSEHRTVDMVDRALRDAAAPTRTRRWLLERAAAGAAGAAGVAAAGALGPVAGASASPSAVSIRAFGEVAVTTEAFTVTLLTELLRRVSHHPEVPAGVKAVFEGAYAAEVDHFRFTRKHWRPATTTFWIPDGAYGGAGDALSLTSVGKTLLAGETLFVDLYLIGVTTFAQAGRATFARISGELAGVESEHRVLAGSLLNLTPPNDVGFEEYLIRDPRGVIQALENAGIGFGKRGATPGRFYTLPHPIMPPPLKIRSNRPR
jgi:hypothetical protein